MVGKKGIFKVFALKQNCMVVSSTLTKTFTKAIATSAFLMLLMSSSVAVYAEEGGAQINLRDVEIPTLVEMVSRITGKSFVVDPRVKGRVTVITVKIFQMMNYMKRFYPYYRCMVFQLFLLVRI